MASFFIGLMVQSFKICVDTIVQAHVADGFKGRAFTFYDMIFNSAFVLAGVVAAVTLPPTGVSTAAFLVIAVVYAGCAAALWVISRRLPEGTLERGTEDLTERV